MSINNYTTFTYCKGKKPAVIYWEGGEGEVGIIFSCLNSGVLLAELIAASAVETVNICVKKKHTHEHETKVERLKITVLDVATETFIIAIVRDVH